MKITTFKNVRTPDAPVEYTDMKRLFERMREPDKLAEAEMLSKLYVSDKPAFDAIKASSQPAFCIGYFSKRDNNSCVEFDSHMGFDVDHVPPGMMKELLDKIGRWEYNYLTYPSISGAGFRVFIRTDCTAGNRSAMYQYGAALLSAYTGIPLETEITLSERRVLLNINSSTSEVARLWFYSGVKDWRANSSSKVLSCPEPEIDDNPLEHDGMDSLFVTEVIVKEIEFRRIDITADYHSWYDNGMALASLGENGRGFYHRISSFHPDYKPEKTDKKFDNFVKTASGRKTIKTFYHNAKMMGIKYVESQFWKPQRKEPVAQPTKVLSVSELRAKLNAHKFVYSQKPKDVDFVLKAHISGETFDIGGFGMLGLITGLEKSRKTTFLQAITASGIASGKRTINFEMDLKGKRTIYVDTEQPEFFFWSGQRRSHDMAGMTGEAERYEAYRMRGFTVAERVASIDLLVEEEKNVGLLIIDGVLDLVTNYNNEEQCQAIAQKIMEWTDKSGAMVLAVIHVTKSSGNTTGHLGSMLNKKCDFSFEMRNDMEKEVTTVNSRLSRTRPFKSFDFTQDENGFPVLANYNERKSEELGTFEEQVLFPHQTAIPPSPSSDSFGDGGKFDLF